MLDMGRLRNKLKIWWSLQLVIKEFYRNVELAMDGFVVSWKGS